MKDTKFVNVGEIGLAMDSHICPSCKEKDAFNEASGKYECSRCGFGYNGTRKNLMDELMKSMGIGYSSSQEVVEEEEEIEDYEYTYENTDEENQEEPFVGDVDDYVGI